MRSTNQLHGDSDFGQISPISVRCDGWNLEPGCEREACAVAEGQALTL